MPNHNPPDFTKQLKNKSIASIPIKKIQIIQSLPNGEMLTGSKLYEDICAAKAFHNKSIQIALNNISSVDDFKRCLNDLEREVTNVGLFLHMECHGDARLGLELSNGSIISWTELKELITPLNIATRCKLVVVLAMCDGAHSFGELLASEVVNGGRAACYALVGPTEDVLTHELLSVFTTFYTGLLDQSTGIELLVKLLNAPLQKGRFFFSSAKKCFDDARRIYQTNYASSSAREKRALKIASDGGAIRKKAAIKKLLIREDESIFKNIYPKYFLLDLYPENAWRFPFEQ